MLVAYVNGIVYPFFRVPLWKLSEMQCVCTLWFCFLPSSEEEFAYTLETSTINSALLSHQWSNVCTQYTMPGDRSSIAYSYVHIVLALRLLGVAVGYYLRLFAFMFSGVSQLSFVCSWEQGWMIGKADKAVVSGAPFSQSGRGAPLWLPRLVFALFCLKADEPLWSKSYVFQNKAKNVPKEALQQL